ncbi:uncharacterized protein LOC128724768 [Anopheles nili]|uniref:uncharacterized protein LOC128724768 n=1 Tax=Anopheles nili TaxID=185578 RepID=UPI00237B31F7|nr:uncharacterized protein LOC128724768 [Anopheles nili]
MTSTAVLVLTLWACFVQLQLHQVDGQATTVQKYPFMNAIAFNREFVGNGVILAPQWVLTTASVCLATPDTTYDVLYGADDYLTYNGANPVERIFRHSGRPGPENNLALVNVRNAVGYTDTIQPIQLADSNTPDVINVTLVAYGKTESSQTHLREQPFMLTKCENTLTDPSSVEVVIHDSGWCVASQKDAIQELQRKGQGAPMVVNGQLYGLYTNEFTIMPNPTAKSEWIQGIMAGKV